MPSLPVLGDQLRLSLFEPSDLGLQALQVDARELRLRLVVLQVVIPVLLLDQRLDLTSKKPQEGVPVDAVVAVLELAGPDRLDDLILRSIADINGPT